MSEPTASESYRSLMLVSPKLYRYITDGLEAEYRIHSYDIQMFGKKENEGVEAVVKFGEQFDHEQRRFFKNEEIVEGHQATLEFIQETGDKARQILIDDYFKIMAP